MNFKVILNPKWTKEQHNKFLQKIKDNDNYCPCMIIKNETTKCICEDFRNKIEDKNYVGECHCGRYLKQIRI